MDRAYIITQHAIEQYMGRSKISKTPRSLKRAHDRLSRMLDSLSQSVKLGRNRYYTNGLVLVVKANKLVTVYKPEGEVMWSKIRDAFSRIRA